MITSWFGSRPFILAHPIFESFINEPVAAISGLCSQFIATVIEGIAGMTFHPLHFNAMLFVQGNKT
jgi:hypothetical protein